MQALKDTPGEEDHTGSNNARNGTDLSQIYPKEVDVNIQGDVEEDVADNHHPDNAHQSDATTNGVKDHLTYDGDIVAAETETETVQQSAGNVSDNTPDLNQKTEQEPGGTRDAVEETEETLTDSRDSAPELARHESSEEGEVDAGNTVVETIEEADLGGDKGEEEAEVSRTGIAITTRECVNQEE